MIRLVFVVIMLIISGIIYLVKAGVGKVTGTEVTFKGENDKVMHTAAKGINWMNQQWENAKSGNNVKQPGYDDFTTISATEIIAKIKANPISYAKAEDIYIEQAVRKMNNRQFDDANKLVMQLQEEESRNYMLNEIEQKRNA